MKALVTGAAGFVGSHLVETLVREGWETTCFVLEGDDLRWIRDTGARIVTGDCTCKETIFPALSDRPDVIFHLAVVTNSTIPELYHQVNFEGTKNVVEACLESDLDLKRFVFPSSLAVLGPTQDGRPLGEDDECNPVTDYGRSKLEAENYLRGLGDRLPLTILRMALVYGPRLSLGIFPIFRLASRGLKFVDGEMKTSIVYVEDVVRSLLLTAERDEALHRTYQVGEERPYTDREITNAIGDAVGTRTITIKMPGPMLIMTGAALHLFAKVTRTTPLIDLRRISDIRHRCWLLDTSRIRDELGFTTQVDLREGTRRAAEWYRSEGWIR